MHTHRYRLAARLALFAALIVGWLYYATRVTEQPSAAAEPEAEPIPIVISRETTYLTEPLTEDGTVDYYAALNARYGHDIKPEENAAIPLWEIGRHEVHDEALAQLYQIWNVERPRNVQPLTVPLLTSPVREKGRRLENQFYKSVKAPWTEETYPKIAQWLQANERALDAVHQAIQRPKYYLPCIYDPNRPHAGILDWGSDSPRALGRMLVARAMLRMGDQQFDAAWDHLIATARLGRLVGTGATYLEILSAWSLEGMASNGMLEYLKHAPVTPENAQACRAAFAALPSRASFINALNHDERVVTIQFTLDIARDPGELRFLAAVEQTPFTPADVAAIKKADFNAALRAVNRHYDQWVMSIRQAQGVARLRQVETLYQQLESQKLPIREVLARCRAIQSGKDAEAAGKMIGDLIARMTLSGHDESAIVEATRQQQVILIDVGFALAAWHARHGQSPEKLAELVPDYLAELPRDQFREALLNYRRTKQGYVLYSVGPNGKDEKGRDSRRPYGQNDDIALRIERRP